MFKKKKTNKLIKFKRNVKKPLTHHICCHKYESSNSWSSKFLNFHWTMRDASFETIDSSWTKLSKRYYTQWPEYWLMDARDASPPPLICFRKYRHCVFANQPTLPLLLAEQWADFVPPPAIVSLTLLEHASSFRGSLKYRRRGWNTQPFATIDFITDDSTPPSIGSSLFVLWDNVLF